MTERGSNSRCQLQYSSSLVRVERAEAARLMIHPSYQRSTESQDKIAGSVSSSGASPSRRACTRLGAFCAASRLRTQLVGDCRRPPPSQNRWTRVLVRRRPHHAWHRDPTFSAQRQRAAVGAAGSEQSAAAPTCSKRVWRTGLLSSLGVESGGGAVACGGRSYLFLSFTDLIHTR